uniref:CopG-like ribbon-helix-helix domain-containing protein n=1 Tax=Candidatus Kentrum sp. LPFa TaxID=2126335 RepID=A0A450WTK8_9GAMM|nr:MAG: hypothetical protein BECKLPF1236B_GA0070989_12093 [Candidatus Kentron sp. LPFa]
MTTTTQPPDKQPARNKVISVWVDEETQRSLRQRAKENLRSISNQAAIYLTDKLRSEPRKEKG